LGVVLSGGSAFGLATADGVANWLEEQGTGYPVGVLAPIARVPIVGAAIVLDRAVAVPGARPGALQGRAACDAATSAEPPEGGVGAGAGCVVAKVAGLQYAWRGGQGVVVRRAAGVTVGALVVNNAVGEVIDDDGSVIVPSRAPPEVQRYPYHAEALASRRRPAHLEGPTASTVIGCIVTDAALSKIEAYRVADLGHAGIVRAVRPAHTSMDGDALFCLATGRVQAHVDLVAALAADVVAEACRRGPRAAVSVGEVPGLADAAPAG
ncbi:MAG TPA: P1 family peptidase, partial [Nitriliruptorales bacterium]|nr:P1 family peptidase [Nitriliruptorales bacterium]